MKLSRNTFLLLALLAGGGWWVGKSKTKEIPSQKLEPREATLEPKITAQNFPTSVLLGGASTYLGEPSTHSFSQPSQNMPPTQKAQFFMGDSLFARSWVFAPSSLKSSDGLGPLFNARACQSCHIKDGRGHLPTHPKDTATSALVKLALLSSEELAANKTDSIKKPTTFPLAKLYPHPSYGFQFHDVAMPSLKPEGHLLIQWQVRPQFSSHYSYLLFKPQVTFTQLGYGVLDERTHRSLRIAPPMIGLGLLEAIPEERLLELVDPMDHNQDGISGRISWISLLPPLHPPHHDSKYPHNYHIGRFGWKAAKPTLMAQNLSAFFHDLSMTSALHSNPAGDCQLPTQKSCVTLAQLPQGESEVDISPEIADLILFYSRSLAPPMRRIPKEPKARKQQLLGEQLFKKIHCASCHTPSHRTSSTYPIKHLRNQTIYPYTDMLLHDMGELLDDGFSTPHASSSEWRTPPLWGLGLTQLISPEAGFLHDGRARTLEEAILWHGGEAQNSKNHYLELTQTEKQALLSFLRSL